MSVGSRIRFTQLLSVHIKKTVILPILKKRAGARLSDWVRGVVCFDPQL